MSILKSSIAKIIVDRRLLLI